MKTLKDYLEETIRRYGAVGTSPGMGYTLESSGTVDMTGKKCTACKKGTYQETEFHDDMDGALHCTKCNKKIKRHQPADSKKKNVSEGGEFPSALWVRSNMNISNDQAHLLLYNFAKQIAAQHGLQDKVEKIYSLAQQAAISSGDHTEAGAKFKQLLKKYLDQGVTETAGVKYGVFAKGGSVGSQRFRDDPVKTFDTKEEAIVDARRRRSDLSPGERGYYRMSYIVKPIKGVTEGEGSTEFNKIKTTPYKANQMLGGKDPVAFVIEVLCPDQSVVNMIQSKVGTAYQIERDDSIEGNGIGIEIISQRFEGGRTAQAAYKQILDIIKQSGGQFNDSTEVTIARQTQGVAEASPRQHPKRYQSAIDAWNRFMDEPESTPKDELQSRHDQTKKRIKTNTIAGPKGQLPEQDVSEGNLNEFLAPDGSNYGGDGGGDDEPRQYRVIITLYDDSAHEDETAERRIGITVTATSEQAACDQAETMLLKSDRYDGSRITNVTARPVLDEQTMSRAAKGYEKYGREGMAALAKAGREGRALDPVRQRYDRYDEAVAEGSDKGWVPNPDNPGYYIHRSDLPQTGKVSDPAKAKLGRLINRYFGKIYNYGNSDDSLDYLDNNAPLWNSLFDKHDGDIDAIISNEPADMLKKAALELKTVADDLKYELDEAVAEGSGSEELRAIDGDYYEDSTDFFSRFDQDHFDREEESDDGMEIRGYIDDKCVMVFKFSTPDLMGGWGIYDDSALMSEGHDHEEDEDEGETCPECDGAGCPECYGDEDRDRAHDHAQGMERESTGMAEAGKDVMRHRGDTTVKIVKRRGVPVGEIGIDADASEGNGQYYVKLYDGSYDAVGFDTAAEALAELKYAISSSMEEDAASNDPLLAKAVDLAPVGALEESAELRLILQRAKLIE